MLNKLMERDQIGWACSAQDAKLLPKSIKKGGNLVPTLKAQQSTYKWPERKKK